jgi:hypothetical protein
MSEEIAPGAFAALRGQYSFLDGGVQAARMVHILALDHEGAVPEQQRSIEIRSIWKGALKNAGRLWHAGSVLL